MRLVVGLGNPGKKYQNTRHNVGFIFIDELAKRLTNADELPKFELNKKLTAEIFKINYHDEEIVLAKPQTFMNDSGRAVAKMMSFWQMEIKDLIIVLDDKDLPIGATRIRNEGGSAGHNGLQNIIDVLGSEHFTRVRIGILSEQKEKYNISTKDYVLDKIAKNEKELILKTIQRTVDCLIEFIGSQTEIPNKTI